MNNAALKEDRELPIIRLLHELWHNVMEERTSRLNDATEKIHQGQKYTKFVVDSIQEAVEAAAKLKQPVLVQTKRPKFLTKICRRLPTLSTSKTELVHAKCFKKIGSLVCTPSRCWKNSTLNLQPR